MNFCFFGSYDPTYSRNKILADGLIKNNAKVFHCRSTRGSFVGRYVDLAKQYIKIWKKIDVIFVAFVGQLDMPLAWILARLTRKKIILDMFYSMYNTYVFDRKSTTPYSLRAKSYYMIDKLALILADSIITDTKTHAQYYQRTFGIHKKINRIFVGGDDTIFSKKKKVKNKKITIEFHGMFTRLHGAEYFVRAAKKMEKHENIQFLLIGDKNSFLLPHTEYIRLRPKTMQRIKKIRTNRLAQYVVDSDISIGHLGTTEKAKSVITNKTFHALACETAAIVGDCPANRELLTDNKNAVFVKMGSVDGLVEKITLLVRNKKLRTKIARNGYQLYQKTLTNKHLGKQLLQIARKS